MLLINRNGAPAADTLIVGSQSAASLLAAKEPTSRISLVMQSNESAAVYKFFAIS
jgi:hypothetical protein